MSRKHRIIINNTNVRTMVKGGCADLRTDVDAKDIRLLPIVLSHAFGLISGVLIWVPPFGCHLSSATVWAPCFVTGTLLRTLHVVRVKIVTWQNK